jgi:hypothetical protein
MMRRHVFRFRKFEAGPNANACNHASGVPVARASSSSN